MLEMVRNKTHFEWNNAQICLPLKETIADDTFLITSELFYLNFICIIHFKCILRYFWKYKDYQCTK